MPVLTKQLTENHRKSILLNKIKTLPTRKSVKIVEDRNTINNLINRSDDSVMFSEQMNKKEDIVTTPVDSKGHISQAKSIARQEINKIRKEVHVSIGELGDGKKKVTEENLIEPRLNLSNSNILNNENGFTKNDNEFILKINFEEGKTNFEANPNQNSCDNSKIENKSILTSEINNGSKFDHSKTENKSMIASEVNNINKSLNVSLENHNHNFPPNEANVKTSKTLKSLQKNKSSHSVQSAMSSPKTNKSANTSGNIFLFSSILDSNNDLISELNTAKMIKENKGTIIIMEFFYIIPQLFVIHTIFSSSFFSFFSLI